MCFRYSDQSKGRRITQKVSCIWSCVQDYYFLIVACASGGYTIPGKDQVHHQCINSEIHPSQFLCNFSDINLIVPLLLWQHINNKIQPSQYRVQVLCESRVGRPGLSVLMSLMVSVVVKQHRTMLRYWPQFVPNMSTDIRGHKALHNHHQASSFSASVTIIGLLSFSYKQ